MSIYEEVLSECCRFEILDSHGGDNEDYVSWDVTWCNPTDHYQPFRGTF